MKSVSTLLIRTSLVIFTIQSSLFSSMAQAYFYADPITRACTAQKTAWDQDGVPPYDTSSYCVENVSKITVNKAGTSCKFSYTVVSSDGDRRGVTYASAFQNDATCKNAVQKAQNIAGNTAMALGHTTQCVSLVAIVFWPIGAACAAWSLGKDAVEDSQKLRQTTQKPIDMASRYCTDEMRDLSMRSCSRVQRQVGIDSERQIIRSN